VAPGKPISCSLGNGTLAYRTKPGSSFQLQMWAQTMFVER
jgi:hypothetical protein